jgi:hypothetical protein
VSGINLKIVEYIKRYSSQGYSVDKIRQFLIANNTPQNDVDEAIAYINNSNNSIQNQNFQQPIQNNAFEMQLKGYMQTQMNNGYNLELIKNTLINRGYNPGLVHKIASEIGNVNINVKHEVNISKGTIIGIVASLFIIGIVVFGILNISMFKPKDSLLDITVSTTSYSYIPGETVNYQLHISNMGTLRGFDTTIKCLIVDDNSNVITRKEETLAVETTASVNRNIPLPVNIKPGKYTLKLIADYGDKQATTSAEIEVVQSVADKKPPITPPTTNRTTPVTPTPERNTSTGIITVPPSSSTTSFGKSFGEVLTEVKLTASSDPESAADICIKLKAENQKDVCYSVVADTSKRNSYCDRIISVSSRDDCYLSFLINLGDVEVCDKITDANDKEFCNQLKILRLMDQYYKEGNSEKIIELSKQLNPDIYGNTPEIQTYEYTYSEPITILDIMNGAGADVTPEEVPPEEIIAPEVNLSDNISSNESVNETI